MTRTLLKLSTLLLAAGLFSLPACGDDDVATDAGNGGADVPSTPLVLNQAVNSFQNAMATGGVPFTVDAQGPIDVADGVELPGFAFGTYDVDVTSSSLTMNLVANIADLQITQYDDTTFDRYYYEFNQPVDAAELASTTDSSFAATVELIAPGTAVTTEGAFVDGAPMDFTFENGGIQITIGDGTDLNMVSANGGSLTVNF